MTQIKNGSKNCGFHMMLHLDPFFLFVSIFFWGLFTENVGLRTLGEGFLTLLKSDEERFHFRLDFTPPTALSCTSKLERNSSGKRRFKWDLSLKLRQKNISTISTVSQHLRGSKIFLKRSGERKKSFCFKWQIQNTSVRKG